MSHRAGGKFSGGSETPGYPSLDTVASQGDQARGRAKRPVRSPQPRNAAHMRLFHCPTLPAAPVVILLISASLALAGCGQASGTDGAENEVADNVQVTLPPAIKMSHVYRCEDNSVVTIDFLSDDVTINLRVEQTISQLKAPTPGEAFTDGKHTVDGDGTNIELSRPGKASLTCKM